LLEYRKIHLFYLLKKINENLKKKNFFFLDLLKKVWGNATKNGETIQLRALDWDFDGPFRKHPAIIVYHPSSP
jgi:hypothetical protein